MIRSSTTGLLPLWKFFIDPIIDMLHERDKLLAEKKAELGDAVFENKTVEIMSRTTFDL